jgi:hypothetical protein
MRIGASHSRQWAGIEHGRFGRPPVRVVTGPRSSKSVASFRTCVSLSSFARYTLAIKRFGLNWLRFAQSVKRSSPSTLGSFRTSLFPSMRFDRTGRNSIGFVPCIWIFILHSALCVQRFSLNGFVPHIWVFVLHSAFCTSPPSCSTPPRWVRFTQGCQTRLRRDLRRKNAKLASFRTPHCMPTVRPHDLVRPERMTPRATERRLRMMSHETRLHLARDTRNLDPVFPSRHLGDCCLGRRGRLRRGRLRR